MLNDVMLNVFMLNVIMLSVTMLNVIVLNVFMPSVVVPIYSHYYEESVVDRIKSNLLLIIFWLHIINYNS